MPGSVDNAGVQDLFPEPIAGWIRVAVDRPIDQAGTGLSYAVPPELADLEPGEAVIVPLGRGNTRTAGWVMCSPSDAAPTRSGSVKHVLARHDRPQLSPDLLELGQWMARYYLAPLGPTLSSMMPAPVRRQTGRIQRRFYSPAAAAAEEGRLGPAQRKILDTILAIPAEDLPIERTQLRDRASVATFGPITALVERGLLEEHRRTVIESRWSPRHLDSSPAPTPTETQQKIIDAVAECMGRGFSSHVLRGVTGSGKTEVYLRLIELLLEMDQHALILVPEIALTPQTATRLASRFPDESVGLIHSALPPATRHAYWDSIRRGETRIVLGARSGVFAPIPPDRLGLVVVDEEHDASFKQDSPPRYHGRDVAIQRAHIAQCPILLCSATPSLETWQNANTRSDWTLHRLPERAPGLSTPRTRIVNMTEERRRDAKYCGALGPTLRAALSRTLEAGHQALLLLNRRGWATHIACSSRACGWVLECEHCDVTMVYHRAGDLPTGGFLRCHHCQREVRLPRSCPDCGGKPVRLGSGTQRIEEEVVALRPDLIVGKTLYRMDSDSMNRADQFHTVLGAFQRGEIRVLLGTQMIAKGLDVPGVRLVGVIDADTALHMPDFRAAERTMQLVAQVTGRCGRSDATGTAIVQTLDPEAASITMACDGRIEEFLEYERAQRQDAALPPITRMARIVTRDADLTACERTIDDTAKTFHALAPEGGSVIGPMPCPLARIRGRHRREVLLAAPTADILQLWLHHARREMALNDPSLVVDVDPISLL